MGLENTYRIVHCKEYDEKRIMQNEWWEVECFKSKWWSFGKRWFTETQALWSTGGDFDVPLKFFKEQDAFEYIGRISQKVPKSTIIREPVTSFV